MCPIFPKAAGSFAHPAGALHAHFAGYASKSEPNLSDMLRNLAELIHSGSVVKGFSVYAANLSQVFWSSPASEAVLY